MKKHWRFIIISIISIIIITISYILTIDMFKNINKDQNSEGPNYGGIFYLFGIIFLAVIVFINLFLNISTIVKNIKIILDPNISRVPYIYFIITHILLLIGNIYYFILLENQSLLN